MANQVISVNRKKYAVGLFWQPLGTRKVGRNYARNLARSVDRKLNLFTEYRAMVGLGSRRAGHRAGMMAAAAEVMEAFPEYSSFLAVFRIDLGYFLVAVRNGIILEDKIFESEADARSEYVRLSEIPDWGAFIAPGAWSMPRAVERSLPDLISRNARAMLHSVSRFRAGLFSLILIGIFLFIMFMIFRDPIMQLVSPRPRPAQIDPVLAEEYKRQIIEKNKELDERFNIQKTPPPPPLVMPYDNLPSPAARAELCYQAIGFLMQPITGWHQVMAECNETHAVAQFRRDFGTLGDFYNIATQLMPGTFVQERGEDEIMARAALPALPAEPSLDERDAETLLRDVTSAFQGLDTPINAQIVVDVLSNGVDTAQLNIVEISADSKLAPMQFMKIFDEFGGVYMTRCVWNTAGRIWNYEVIIYAK